MVRDDAGTTAPLCCHFILTMLVLDGPRISGQPQWMLFHRQQPVNPEATKFQLIKKSLKHFI